MTKFRNRAGAFVSTYLAASFSCVSLAVFPISAAAELPDIQWSSTLSFDREIQMTFDAGALSATFETAPSLLTAAKVVTTRPNGARLTYGADILMTGNGLATTNGATEVQGGLLFNYRQKFGTDTNWQYQVRGEFDVLMSDSDLVFQRPRLGVHLKYRSSAQHSTAGFVRIGYRNQNDDRLAGYDQSEFVGSITHTWRPADFGTVFSGTFYTETRNADFARYSYDEQGLRFVARTALSDASEITVRMSYYERAFQDQYSAAIDQFRDDTRIKFTVGLDHDFSDQLSANLFAGWDGNVSTISEVAYDGAVAGLAVTYQWQ